jgi:hypothetical protein
MEGNGAVVDTTGASGNADLDPVGAALVREVTRSSRLETLLAEELGSGDLVETIALGVEIAGA